MRLTDNVIRQIVKEEIDKIFNIENVVKSLYITNMDRLAFIIEDANERKKIINLLKQEIIKTGGEETIAVNFNGETYAIFDRVKPSKSHKFKYYFRCLAN